MPATHRTEAPLTAASGDSDHDEPTRATAARSVATFERWLAAFGDVSQDPYDYWASPLGSRAKKLYYRRPLLGHIAAAPFVALDLLVPSGRQLVRRPSRQAIGDAHYALAFFKLATPSGEGRRLERGRSFLRALAATRSPAVDEPAWGYTFDWPSRYGLFPAHTPLITTIPYCYEAFEAGFEATGDEAHLRTMAEIAQFAAERIPVTRVAPGVDASAYSPLDRTLVVNASAYRGFLLNAAGKRFDRDDWRDAGRRNIEFVLRSQNDDGSWPYAKDRDDDFIDNFHTCLVLKNLVKVSDGESAAVDTAIAAGYSFYLEYLLDETGLPIPFAVPPRLTLHRRELYDLAEGVNLAHLARAEMEAARAVRTRLVTALADEWQLPDGHFATCELLVGRNTVPYHRWAQAQAFHALAQLVADEGGST